MRYEGIHRRSEQLRQSAVLVNEQKVLIARLSGSTQEKDLTEPVNCGGFGRIRHFRIQPHTSWSADPLPNLPAARALRRPPMPVQRTQVFQLAACNLRCWYCFVDTDRLSASTQHASFLSSAEMIDMFLDQPDRPDSIDLSGGQPDLVPEWGFWMLQELEARGLSDQVYLWTDDNLTCRFHWQYLTSRQRHYLAEAPNYGRVGCFKGYDYDSFAYNTRAAPALFDNQFAIFSSLLSEGLDMYAYVTFTSAPVSDLDKRMCSFVDRLQHVHEALPLRTIPLHIVSFTPVAHRLQPHHEQALHFQSTVHAAWRAELDLRFSRDELAKAVTDVSLQR